MPDIGNGKLEAWRKSAVVYRRGFMRALTFFPAEGFQHMREALDAQMSAVPPYTDLQMAVEDVTIFERDHPDMDTFAAGLGLSAEAVDAIYQVAIAAEAGASNDELSAMVSTA